MNETIVKHLNFGEDAKSAVFSGIDKLTQAVSSTLGASGKCVILEDTHGNPKITKDGVTVADAVILLDPVENMGARLLKEAARKTVAEAGDGTTTATVLAHAILSEADKHKDLNPRELKHGINLAVDKVVQYLEKHSSEVKGDVIEQVATISANNDRELGQLIGQAFRSVDETGIVTMETHDKPETIIEQIEGVQYDAGYQNSHFITNKDNGSVELDSPLVLIVESAVENVRKIQSILEHVIKNKRSLLIVAPVDQQVKAALLMNKVKGNIKVNIVDLPGFGPTKEDTCEDLAILVGATIINENLGDDLDLIDVSCLGEAYSAVTDNKTTVLTIEAPDGLEERIKSIQVLIDKWEKNPLIQKKHRQRLAMLSGSVGVVKVGADSKVELKEKKDRIEDAIYATKAALKEGIVPGGGVALLNASQKIPAKAVGEKILLKAIQAPFYTVLDNAGITMMDGYEDHEGYGIDVVTGERATMISAGIIDPVLVTKSALKNAVSVVSTIISADCVISNMRMNESNQ